MDEFENRIRDLFAPMVFVVVTLKPIGNSLLVINGRLFFERS